MKKIFQSVVFTSSLLFMSHLAFAANGHEKDGSSLPLPSAEIPLAIGLGLLALKKLRS